MRLSMLLGAVLVGCVAGCAGPRTGSVLHDSPDAVIQAFGEALFNGDAEGYWALLSKKARTSRGGGIDEIRRAMQRAPISNIRVLTAHRTLLRHILYPVEVVQQSGETGMLHVVGEQGPDGWWIGRVENGSR